MENVNECVTDDDEHTSYFEAKASCSYFLSYHMSAPPASLSTECDRGCQGLRDASLGMARAGKLHLCVTCWDFMCSW